MMQQEKSGIRKLLPAIARAMELLREAEAECHRLRLPYRHGQAMRDAMRECGCVLRELKGTETA